MGFLLLAGIRAGLGRFLPQGGGITLDRLAETIAAGNLAAAEAGGVGLVTARAALIQGFGWVTLYGACCAWGLSALSLLTFGRPKIASVEAGQM